MYPKLIGAALLIAVFSPALAQSVETTQATGRSPQEEYQRGYAATPMPGQTAINAGGAAGTAGLNNQAGAASQDAANADATAAGANQAQYDADRAAYMDALARHDAAVDRSDARWRRQQNAYADAMAVWRAQRAACLKGSGRACNQPTPNPADYY